MQPVMQPVVQPVVLCIRSLTIHGRQLAEATMMVVVLVGVQRSIQRDCRLYRAFKVEP